MIDSSGLSETTAKLQLSLDDIAAQVMLGSDSIHPEIVDSWIGTLKWLSASAAQQDLAEVAQMTANLADVLPDGDSTPILDSITKLQNALSLIEEEKRAVLGQPEQIEFSQFSTAEESSLFPSQELQPAHGSELPEQQETTSAAQVDVSTSLASDPELVAEFISESRDHLSSLEGQLLALENDVANRDAVDSIFRSFHTIKGLAGFLDFPAIQTVAHEVETLLDLARNKQLSISGPVVDIILEGADYLKDEIEAVEARLEGRIPSQSRESGELIRRVRALMTASPEVAVTGEESFAPSVALERTETPETIPVPTAELACEPSEAVTVEPEKKAPPSERNADIEAARFIKIDTAKLDFLVDMVGELLISQSILRHNEFLVNAANPLLQRNLSHLSRITADVQKTAMSMRMVPVGQLFRRSVRLIRDLTRKSGKKVELELSGEDTELDRTLVEALADPLMHMIRNAADHGIETPAERAANGKNPVARIALKAFHQAGHITVQLSDDGRGLNRARILSKAIERGLVPSDAQLTDAEVYNLIFEPGFSTAEKVTDISGRGVGMDVVRRHVQKLRGRIEIQSTPGKGATFSIKLPLTLAIIDGLVVSVGKERYIVPIYAVREMFRPSPDKLFTVEGKAEMLLVRGSLLPVVRLHKVFGVTPNSFDASASLAVVAESGPSRFCLLVDDMLGKQEVVIKSLGEALKKVPCISGGAILGDGRVGLILDVDAVYGDRTHAIANAS